MESRRSGTAMARITFRIHYHTRWGESLLLEHRGAVDVLGEGCSRTSNIQRSTFNGEPPGNQPSTPSVFQLPMHYAGAGYWTVSLHDAEPGTAIEYRYVFRSEAGDDVPEPVFRQLEVPDASLSVVDDWLPPESPEAACRRQAFAGIIFNPDRAGSLRVPRSALQIQGSFPTSTAASGERMLTLTVSVPQVKEGQRVCVSGSSAFFGHWDPARARVMSGARYPLWEIEVPLAQVAAPHELKFGLWSDAEQRLVSFEAGENRQLANLPDDAASILVNCAYYRHATPWKGAGVAIPVFALRSEQGYGIGEFADLEAFAQWAAGCGMHLVQVLPINDTSADFTWRDSYPYKAISTAALHPIYVNLPRLFAACGQPLPEGFAARRDALNRLPKVDYEAVLRDKLAALRQLYAAVGARTLRSRPFKAFLREQGDWLKPYAAFCRLRDQHGTADFTRWGEHRSYAAKRIRAWFKPGAPEHDEVMFHAFVQFHLKAQLDHALAAGHARGVAFKGDLPIGIDRCSVEAWTTPSLFHMDRQTGAPPDFFSALGQNWGFPTYDWPRMEAEGYAWWRQRLARMSACFDALRIDHILGFFRIWEIPREQTEGILGHFNPALPLSRDEIRERGFGGDVDKFCVPAIVESALPQFFGDAATSVASTLMFRDEDGFFRFKPEFASESARARWIAEVLLSPPRRSGGSNRRRPSTPSAALGRDAATAIPDGLKRLGFEVLFVPDPDQPERFHPRIGLMDTAVFKALDPVEQTALRALHDDYFYRRHTQFWEAEAMKKLPALMEATRMLICGEDLGMIPDSVPVVLKRLGVLSLEVQNMPKRLGQRFGHPPEYPYLSVCTTSTHDTPTVRGWWEGDAAARQDYWRDVMHREGEAPDEATPEICRFVIEHSLAGGSMWCVLPWQDWLGIDLQLRHPVAAEERINVPAIPRHYWRYRMHRTIEDLLRATEFNRQVAQLIAVSGRIPAT
jgi:4-alpha-glucanotransferase